MFKLPLKIMVFTIFILFLSVSIAMWKGGETFRYFGDGVIIIGRAIVKFGDFVDEFISGERELRRSYEKLKEIIDKDGDGEGDRKR